MKSLKYKVWEIIKNKINSRIQLKDIKQTNITYRKQHYREQYYFSADPYISSYTLKRFVEIAETIPEAELTESCGNLYWKVNNKIIN